MAMSGRERGENTETPELGYPVLVFFFALSPYVKLFFC